MIPTLIPPRGIGYQTGCDCCDGLYGGVFDGVHLPSDDGDPPALGETYGDLPYDNVISVWSIL